MYMKDPYLLDEEPVLDQNKHPLNVLGEEVWDGLSTNEKIKLYCEWCKPQTEYWNAKRYGPLFRDIGDTALKKLLTINQ